MILILLVEVLNILLPIILVLVNVILLRELCISQFDLLWNFWWAVNVALNLKAKLKLAIILNIVFR